MREDDSSLLLKTQEGAEFNTFYLIPTLIFWCILSVQGALQIFLFILMGDPKSWTFFVSISGANLF